MEKNLPSKSINIKGHTVYYDDETKDGIYYLSQDLDFNEADVFFEYAKMHQKADFEDDRERQFTLFYNSSRGIYWLGRR